LCPNGPPGKEIGETIFLYRYGLLPFVTSKQIQKKRASAPQQPHKDFFRTLSLRGEMRLLLEKVWDS
jgi:hypothetical protein